MRENGVKKLADFDADYLCGRSYVVGIDEAGGGIAVHDLPAPARHLITALDLPPREPPAVHRNATDIEPAHEHEQVLVRELDLLERLAR